MALSSPLQTLSPSISLSPPSTLTLRLLDSYLPLRPAPSLNWLTADSKQNPGRPQAMDSHWYTSYPDIPRVDVYTHIGADSAIIANHL